MVFPCLGGWNRVWRFPARLKVPHLLWAITSDFGDRVGAIWICVCDLDFGNVTIHHSQHMWSSNSVHSPRLSGFTLTNVRFICADFNVNSRRSRLGKFSDVENLSHHNHKSRFIKIIKRIKIYVVIYTRHISNCIKPEIGWRLKRCSELVIG